MIRQGRGAISSGVHQWQGQRSITSSPPTWTQQMLRSEDSSGHWGREERGERERCEEKETAFEQITVFAAHLGQAKIHLRVEPSRPQEICRSKRREPNDRIGYIEDIRVKSNWQQSISLVRVYKRVQESYKTCTGCASPANLMATLSGQIRARNPTPSLRPLPRPTSSYTPERNSLMRG